MHSLLATCNSYRLFLRIRMNELNILHAYLVRLYICKKKIFSLFVIMTNHAEDVCYMCNSTTDQQEMGKIKA